MRYLDYVNIRMGTDSKPEFSRGNTLPLCQLPFGMCAFSPQTDVKEKNSEWFYDPKSNEMDGIRLTHQPSPWIGDFGTLLFSLDKKKAHFDTEKSALMPNYISVYFDGLGARFEIAPSERGGIFKIEFENEGGYLYLSSPHGNTDFRLDNESKVLYGTNDFIRNGNCKNFKMYFAISIDDADFVAPEIENGVAKIKLCSKKAEGRVGISYISYEMALKNLEKELGGKSYVELKSEGEEIWDQRLGRITIESSDDEQKRIFYSCMYRAVLFPNKAYEIDDNGEAMHYSPFTGCVHKGKRYTNNGFWDTYRTSYTLFSMIAREEFAEMLEGFASDYDESGYLPRWTAMGEAGCMPSTLIDAVIAEAVCQGIGDKKLHERLFNGMLHHANIASKDLRFGRKNIDQYLKFGYVPYDFSDESINLSLDFAYGDWCIAKVAKSLGKDEIAREYFERSENYKLLFDKKTGFFRAKSSLGEWREDFDPFVWGYDYTESSAWQNVFGVPHALDAVAEMLGGKEKAREKLDEIFDTPPKFVYGRYGAEIHEMSEMAACDLGQCAISNQPSFTIPFLYAYYGDKKKSDDVIKKITREYFTPDSYPGDEDNGSMSAWYIFATIGKYPTCPGTGEFTETTPLVKNYKIKKEQV
ncbi:MAG: GH92 family glycosyl hydrolase [Clostridia bacterium]|nr:GH92 family glycosyl hydrolase [Clostridia bacterium]